MRQCKNNKNKNTNVSQPVTSAGFQIRLRLAELLEMFEVSGLTQFVCKAGDQVTAYTKYSTRNVIQ